MCELTNIYILYNDIVKEYGADWANKGDDIDLPLVISKKKTPDGVFISQFRLPSYLHELDVKREQM